MSKGNSSCHIPNDKYRDNYERIFRQGNLRDMREWFGTAPPEMVDVVPTRERLLYEEYDHSKDWDE